MASTEQDYHYIVQFLGAAVLSDDPGLFDEFLGWQQTVLTSRGLPPTVLPTSVTELRSVLPDGYPRARALMLSAREMATASGRGQL